jgi:hypothetical protein
MAVDDCHREKGGSTARSKQGCARSWLIHAAVRLTGAIKKHTDRPAFFKSSCCCTNRFSITGSPFHWVSTAGSNNAPQDWNFEQFGFGHERNRTPQGVAKQRWVEMGAVIGDHHQWPLKRNQGVAARATFQESSKDGKHQQVAHELVHQARFWRD